MLRRRTPALSALALSAALLLSACGGVEEGTGETSTAGEVAFNDADVAFVTGMQPHHEQAVDMADLVLADAPSPEVAELAREIKGAQEPELQELAELAQTFGVEGEGDHGGGHGGGPGDGMLGEDEMAALEQAGGPEAERLFLEGMVEHHRGAVEMAETELAEGENADAKDLATRIRSAQTREIAEIEQLLGA